MKYKLLNPSLSMVFFLYVISLLMLVIAHHISHFNEIAHSTQHKTQNRFNHIRSAVYHNSKQLINNDKKISDSELFDKLIKASHPALQYHSYQLILENPKGVKLVKQCIRENTNNTCVTENIDISFHLPPHPSSQLDSTSSDWSVIDKEKLVGWFNFHHNYKMNVTLYHEATHYHTRSLLFWLPTILFFLFVAIGFTIYVRRTQLWHTTIDYSFGMTTPNHSLHKFNTYDPLQFDQVHVGREFSQLAQALNRANYQLSSRNLRVDTLLNRLQRLVTHAPLPIAFINKDGGITFTNERFNYVFMMSTQKNKSLLLQDLLAPMDEPAHKVMANLSEQYLACSIDMNKLHTDQIYQLHLMPWFSTHGQLQGFTVTLNDITPLNAKIEYNVTLVGQQETQLKEFDKLWSVIGHELRTPLSGILGMLELFNTDNLNPEQKETFETLDNTSQAMLFMLNDMLDLAKLDAGKLQISLEKTDILQLCRNTCDLMVGNARRQGIDLLFYFDPDAPRFIQTDASRLSQILMNLIGNAVKFTTSGYVALIVSIKPNENPSDEQAEGQIKNQPESSSIHTNDSEQIMQFEIIDTGIGISGTEQTKLFSFFNQANNDISKKFGGTGLGLAISRNFSQLLGGEVLVESEVGVGSNFQLQIPVSKDYKQPTYQFDADLSHICVVVITKHEISKTHFTKLCQTLKIACIIEVVDTAQESISSRHIENINQQLQKEKYTNLSPILCIEHGILRHEFNQNADELSVSDTSGNVNDRNDIVLTDSQFANIDNFEKLPKILASINPERSISSQLMACFDSYISKPLDVSHLVSELLRLSQKNDEDNKVSKLQHSFNSFMSDFLQEGTADSTGDATKDAIDAVTLNTTKSTILVAEDNAINRKVVAKVLEKMGFTYIAVSNGQEALEALVTHREEIALILMDCRMPILDGLEATKKIRANHNSIPIIALTANNTDEDRKACLLVGMDNFMTKPIKQDALQEMFNKYAIR